MASVAVCAFGCPICVNDFKVKEQKNICTIPCGHVYHEQCLKEWFRVQIQQFHRSNCPKCRAVAEESQIIRLFLHETSSTADDSMEEDACSTYEDSLDDFIVPSREHVQYNADDDFDTAILEFREWYFYPHFLSKCIALMNIARNFLRFEERTRQIMRNHEDDLDDLDDHLVQMNSEMATFQIMLTRLVESVETYAESLH